MRHTLLAAALLVVLVRLGVAAEPTVCLGGTPNGATEVGEECDDGNTVNGDGCDNNCSTSRCGNHQVVAPETCDDGDTDDRDFCPSDCQVDFCDPSNDEIVVRIDTTNADLAALTLFLDYPEGAVSLPGTGTGVPAERVEGPGVATAQVNDFDHLFRLVVFDLFNFGTTAVATVHFTGCAGTPPPDASAFACALDGTPTDENLAPVPGVTCSVTVLDAVPTTTTTTLVATTTLPGETTTTTTTSTTTTTLPCDTVTCLSRNALADPACAGVSVPAPVAKKLQQASAAAEQAAAATGKQQKKLSKKAKAALAAAKRNAKRLARGKRPKLDPACSAAIQSTVATAQGALAAGNL